MPFAYLAAIEPRNILLFMEGTEWHIPRARILSERVAIVESPHLSRRRVKLTERKTLPGGIEIGIIQNPQKLIPEDRNITPPGTKNATERVQMVNYENIIREKFPMSSDEKQIVDQLYANQYL